jgi:hypothetical protein
MRITWAVLAIVTVALLSCACASCDTYYVATGGVDDNPGSSALPWATLQHAVDAIAPGDTILVRAGTYAGCRIGQPGEAGAVKTLAAESGAAVVVNAPGPENRHDSIIEVENRDLPDGVVRYWVIDGLEVCDSPTHYGIDVRNTQYLTVRNCVVHDNAVTGIFDAFSDDNVYEFNESYSNGEHGFYHSNSGDRVTLRGNRSLGTFGCGIHMNGDASMGGDASSSAWWAQHHLGEWPGAAAPRSTAAASPTASLQQPALQQPRQRISLYRIDGEGSNRSKVYNNTIIMPTGSRWAVNIKAPPA